MIYLVTTIEEKTTSTGKPMWRTTLKDEKGVDEVVNLFERPLEGSKIDGEVYTNEKGYRNFKSAQSAAKGAFLSNKKEEVINKAMDKKADQIAAAQDRSSAWMWAKTNAATLIANHPLLKDTRPEHIATHVISLATKIYNGEPTEPFTTIDHDEPEMAF